MIIQIINNKNEKKKLYVPDFCVVEPGSSKSKSSKSGSILSSGISSKTFSSSVLSTTDTFAVVVDDVAVRSEVVVVVVVILSLSRGRSANPVGKLTGSSKPADPSSCCCC